MSKSYNPVPINQRPTNEFIELSKSKIFSWPKSKKSFSLILLKFWLGTFLLFIVILIYNMQRKTLIDLKHKDIDLQLTDFEDFYS